MSDIKVEAKRAQYGSTLIELENQGLENIAVLEGVKNNLLTLKSAVQSEPEFAQEDVDAVDATITTLQASLDTL
jgi:hypothetical protein